MVESLRIGPYTDEKDDMGPVITKEAREKILGLIKRGVDQGANLVVDGRDSSFRAMGNGHFVGGCLFDNVTPEMDIYKTEIFGPRSLCGFAPRHTKKRSTCR